MKAWKGIGCLVVALAFFGCGQKEEAAKGEPKDKARQAVEGVVRREFDYYEGAKQKLGEAGKKLQEQREQEKELN